MFRSAAQDPAVWVIPALAGIVLLGGLLRGWGAVERMRFTGDEARDLIQARNLTARGDFPLVGPRIYRGQGHLGPAYAYLMALPLAAADYDPGASVAVIVVFELAAMVLMYGIGVSLFGRVAGLAGALLYAVSFTMVFYGRWGWHPSLVPCCVLFSFYAMLNLLRGKTAWLPALAAALALGIQLHMSTVLVGLPALAVVWRTRRKLTTRLLAASVAVAVLVLAPLLVHEVRTGLGNLRGMLEMQTVMAGTRPQPYLPFLADIAQIPADQAYWPYGERRILLDGWRWMYGLNVIIVCAAVLWSVVVLRRRRWELALILLWLLLFPLSLARFGGERSHYYMLGWFPVVLLLLGGALAALLKRPRLRWAGMATLGLLLVANLLTYRSYQGVLRQANYDTFLAGPLGMKKRAVNAVLAHAGREPYDLHIVSWHYANLVPYLYLFSTGQNLPVRTRMTVADWSGNVVARHAVNPVDFFDPPGAETHHRPTYCIVEPAFLADARGGIATPGQLAVLRHGALSDE